MADYRNDDRRAWREQERGSDSIFSDERERSYPERAGRGAERSRRYRDEDRGFFGRAADEVRSWFGDEDDYERLGREQGYGGGEDRYDVGRSRGAGRGSREQFRGFYGGGGTRGLERFGTHYRRGQAETDYDERPRPFEGSWGGSAGDPYRERPQSWSEANRGDDRHREESGFGQGQYGERDTRGGRPGLGAGRSPMQERAGSHPDDHYRSWRDRQVEQFDRDYEDYCRERQQQFHQDFDSWRRNRQSRTDLTSGGRPGEPTGAGTPGQVGTGGTVNTSGTTAGESTANTGSGTATTTGGTGRSGGRSRS